MAVDGYAYDTSSRLIVLEAGATLAEIFTAARWAYEEHSPRQAYRSGTLPNPIAGVRHLRLPLPGACLRQVVVEGVGPSCVGGRASLSHAGCVSRNELMVATTADLCLMWKFRGAELTLRARE